MAVTDKTNVGLQESRNNKADEFYTMYEDIELEMNLYNFSGKKVFCPCDNPEMSNFYKFFKNNFHRIGLKSLVSFFYNPGTSYYITYDGKNEIKTYVIGSNAGDFRSPDSKTLMSMCDIIVTNPPFSLFREFIKQVINSGKEYIIMGNVNAITYKEVFSHIVEGRMWLGGTIHSGDRKFYIPDDYPLDGTSCGVDSEGNRYIRVKGVRWFTNVEYIYPPVKHTVLTMNYDPTIHQKYDTYDAINANTMKEIPLDYYDEIGAPITVLDKVNADGYIEFCDKQGYLKLFELIGQLNGGSNRENYDFAKPIINGKCKFKRLIIKRV